MLILVDISVYFFCGILLRVLWSGFKRILFGFFVFFDKGNRFIVKDKDLKMVIN